MTPSIVDILQKAEQVLSQASATLNFWGAKEEQLHPRGGNPKNTGQWSEKSGSKGSKVVSKAKKTASKPSPASPASVSRRPADKTTSKPSETANAAPVKANEVAKPQKRPDQLVAAMEYVPSKDQPDFKDVMALTYEQRSQLNDFMEQSLGDAIRNQIGITPVSTSSTPGGWEGNVNPSPKHVLPPETSEQQARLYANVIGYLARQDGVLVARVKPEEAGGKYTGVVVQKRNPDGTSSPLSREEFAATYQELYKNDPNKNATIGAMQVGNQMLFLNTEWGGENAQWLKDFSEAWSKLASANDYEYDVVSSDSIGVGNNWKEQPNGEAYLQEISQAGRSDLHQWLTGDAGPKAKQLIQQFLQREAGGAAHGQQFSTESTAILDQALKALGKLSLEFRALPPRGGNPDNPGQFSKKAGGYSGKETEHKTPGEKLGSVKHFEGVLEKDGHKARYRLHAGTEWVRISCPETCEALFPVTIKVPEGASAASVMDSTERVGDSK